MSQYEVVVIGAGPGGYEAALKLANAGVKTLLIEKSKKKIGGVCLNEGCIPTKNYLESAGFVYRLPYFKDQGVDIDVKGVDIERLSEKTLSLIDEIRSGVVWLLDQAGVELMFGEASFIDSHTIKVSFESESQNISFERCIVATGSRVREMPQLPLDGKYIISSTDVFGLKRLPASIAIVGGGAIACEFATFFSAFGVDVSMIIRGERVLSNEDEDVSKALTRVFKKRGINIMTSANIKKYELKENKVVLFVDDQEPLECEVVLSAIGRVPNVDGLNLESAGIKQDEKGFVEVSPSFKTSQKHIYALGDCIDTLAYAHTAYAEARIAAHNIINDDEQQNDHIIPSTIFTSPSIASCGLREKDAKEQGLSVEVKKTYFKVNAKAKIHGDDSGFLKILIDSESGYILGATIIGVEATEIIHELVIAVEKKVSADELTKLIHSHPSVSEVISYQ